MVCGVDMDRAASTTESCQYDQRHVSDPAPAGRNNSRGLPWWKLARPTRLGRRRSIIDLSDTPQEQPAPSSTHRLFECDTVTSSGGCERRPSSDKQSWTLGSREGTEAPSPLDFLERDNQATETRLLPAFGDRTEGRTSGERITNTTGSEKQERDAGRESDRRAGLVLSAAEQGTAVATMDSDRPWYPSVVVAGSPMAQRQNWDDVVREVAREVSSQRKNEETSPWEAAANRTPSKASRAVPLSPSCWGNEDETELLVASTQAELSDKINHTARREEDDMAVSVLRPTIASTVDDMSFDEDMDSMAEGGASLAEPTVVYDILAVDRGSGYCDTSVVPFPVDDSAEVPADGMRAITSGQSEFLARRGFAAGLVSHFLEETNCEFRVLQGGTSCGMNEQQLADAAIKLEEVFAPAVKKLRRHKTTEVVLDSLFEGADDAGEFVVRFEVTITRCHPEDLDANPAQALRDCARAIRDAVRDEGVAEQATHEVVFVGRPMWELVSPVLDFSARGGEKSIP